MVKQNWIELLDNDKLVVSENDSQSVLNDCRLGRYTNYNTNISNTFNNHIVYT